MAAPALVALAHGSRDRRSAATIKALVSEVRAMRPDLKVEAAFLELSKPDFHTVVDRLVKAGHDEIVVVPLLLTEAYHAKVDVPAAIAAATERHENLRIRATSVLGLEPVFLEVLDRRLRAALKDARVRELEYRPTTCLLANCSVAAVGGYSEQRAIGSGEQCALRQDTVCDIDECVDDAHFARWRDPVDRSAPELAQREIP